MSRYLKYEHLVSQVPKAERASHKFSDITNCKYTCFGEESDQEKKKKKKKKKTNKKKKRPRRGRSQESGDLV